MESIRQSQSFKFGRGRKQILFILGKCISWQPRTQFFSNVVKNFQFVLSFYQVMIKNGMISRAEDGGQPFSGSINEFDNSSKNSENLAFSKGLSRRIVVVTRLHASAKLKRSRGSGEKGSDKFSLFLFLFKRLFERRTLQRGCHDRRFSIQ
jgi:hypothetical protein